MTSADSTHLEDYWGVLGTSEVSRTPQSLWRDRFRFIELPRHSVRPYPFLDAHRALRRNPREGVLTLLMTTMNPDTGIDALTAWRRGTTLPVGG